MEEQFYREFQTLWFTSSISSEIRLSLGGEDPPYEGLVTAASPPQDVPDGCLVHDRIDLTGSVTQVKIVVQDPTGGPQLVVSSTGATWTRSGSHQSTHVNIPSASGDEVDVEINIEATISPNTYRREQTVRIKHRGNF